MHKAQIYMAEKEGENHFPEKGGKNQFSDKKDNSCSLPTSGIRKIM